MDIPTTTVQAIFDQAAVGIAQIGLDGTWLLVNNRYCQMLGYSEPELRTKTLQDLTHPEDRAEVLAGRRKLLEGLIPSHSMEKRFMRKDGSVFWGRLHRSLLRDDDDLPKFFIAVVEDITQKKEAERALRDSEQRLALATNAAGLGLWDFDLHTGMIVTSGEYARLYGLGLDHLLLTHEEWLGLIHPDDRQWLQVLLRESIETNRIWEAEYRVVWPDGTIHWLLGKGHVFRDDSGGPVRMAGVSLDITDRKRTEEQRLRLASIVESCEDAIFSKDLDGTILSWNSGAEKLFGYPAEEIMGRPLSLLLPPERLYEFPQILERIQSGAHLEHYEVTRMRKDGRRVELSVTISPIRNGAGVVVGNSAIARDITERKHAEEALRESQQRYKESQQRLELAQEAGGIATWDWDIVANQTHCSKEYARLYGLPEDDLAHPPEEWLQLVHPEDRVRVQGELNRALDGNGHYDTEFRVLWPDGTVHWLMGKGEVFSDSSGRPVRMLGVNMDISERKYAERVLRESEERFRNMADTAPVMIWVSGPDRLCTFFNKAWLAFTGRTMEQESGNGWAEGVHPDDLGRCVAHYCSSFDARQTFQMEYRLRRADGQYRWVLDNGVPRFASGGIFAGYIGSCIDITELRRTQEESLARQKLESVGVLAGGIAHDFNNLLGAILAQAELAETQLADGESPTEGIRRISAMASRGAEIVRQLMIYSGQDKADPVEPLNLSQLVEEMLELLKVSISKHAVLKTDLSQDLPAVRGRASQIRQIVMNLVINASEAIEERGGVIEVITSHVVLPRESGRGAPAGLPAGNYVGFEVSDTGGGMTKEVQAKVFDPFFTTKFAGRGLGLAVVQGIVRDHGGAINLISEPGQGTTIDIFLPCAGKTCPSNRDIAQPATGTEHRPASGTVLIVEDEDALRLAVAQMLRKRGFLVIEASDGSSALELVRAHKDEIDAMLLDITLPGVPSRVVFEEARQLHANLKVILTSAYSRQAVDASFTGLPVEGFLRKPFQLVELVGSLQEVLSA
jgi:PAS domain S-box-containing protein